jgi:hypothetical protein
MKSKKPLIIIAAVTSSFLIAGTATAQVVGLPTLNKIIDTQLNKLVPANLKQMVAQIRSGGAIGIDTIGSVFKTSDENGNIDEESWKELDQAALALSKDKAVRNAGLGTSYTLGQLAQTGLKNINDLNNRKGRDIEKTVVDERSEVQNVLRNNSVEAESSLQAENQRNQIAAVAASTELRKLDVQSRSLTAQQIANSNALKQRQEQLAQKRSDQMGMEASAEEQMKLVNIITRPYYGDKN